MTLKDKILNLINELPDNEDIAEVIQEMIWSRYHKEYENYALQRSKDNLKEKAEFYKSLGFDVEFLDNNGDYRIYKNMIKIKW